MNGLSTNRRCTTAAPCLRADGIEFIIRYYSETTIQPEKRLTLAEAQAIDTAGIRLAVVYQDRQNQASDFSRAAGERAGQIAFQYTREIGQPLGTTIFFAVDYDADPADMTRIDAYFQGVALGLQAAAGGQAPYLIGVYGSGFVCTRLRQANLVTHTWLSESTGHRGSATYQNWNIKQSVTKKARCGLPAGSWQRCESQGSDNSWSFRLGAASPVLDAVPLPAPDADPLLRKGAQGTPVTILQRLLNRWLLAEGATLLIEDGDFGKHTEKAVIAFQSSHIDNTGLPLRADGVAGGLTWGALRRVTSGQPDPKSLQIVTPGTPTNWWGSMPDPSSGGTPRGLAALRIAVAEAAAGRGESGGNNMGRDVDKYLNGLVNPPANWCAGFVCWCLSQSGPMPFGYTVSARSIRTKAIAAGLTTYNDPTVTAPLPGDIVVWWRESLQSWKGHVGFVHHVANGRIYTIEGNKTSKVEGFSYPLAGMDRLLGFVRL